MISLATRNAQPERREFQKLQMIMLREYATDGELHEALQQSAVFPELLFTHFCIKTYLSKVYPCNTIRVFSYPYTNPLYWFIAENKKGAKPQLQISQGTGKHDSTTFLTGLKLFLEEVQKTLPMEDVLFAAEQHLLLDLSTIFGQLFEHYELEANHDPTTIFYMTPEQIDDLNQVELVLPYGYEFSEFQADNDLELVHESWKQASTIEHTRDRLTYLPSVFIRHGTELVSFEMSSQYGALSNQFTIPEHRRKGLGRNVELKLSQNVSRNGMVPFKVVDTYNQSVVRMAEESAFWTVVTRNGAPVQFCYQFAKVKSS